MMEMSVVSHHLQLGSRYSYYRDVAEEIISALIESSSSEHHEEGRVAEPVSSYGLFPELQTVPFPSQLDGAFTFIDLFAGIGGIRLAMQSVGGTCLFSSEWDKQAQQTYLANFGELPFGDITSPVTKSFIPKDFDVLCGGFPCQAFSIAGYRKGFEDTRGTLFFDIAEIASQHHPKVLLRDVLQLKEGELVTMDTLNKYGMDSILVRKVESLEEPATYKIDFCRNGYERYDQFTQGAESEV